MLLPLIQKLEQEIRNIKTLDKMKNSANIKALVLGLGLLSGMAFGQKITSNAVKTVVSGTSTLHDWKMTSENGTFSGNVSGNAIQDIQYSMVSKSIKSGKGPMDTNAYKAMQADKYPNITFSASSINIGKGTMTGKLTVTNITKTISLPVNVTKAGNTYTVWGSAAIKMTDFGVTPPSFMMNTVKTGNDITITVNAVAK